MDKQHEMVDLEEIKRHLLDELIPSKNGLYQCPLCGSGTGPHKTGALKVYGDNKDYWKCHACGVSGDIFDLVSRRDNISMSEATKRMIDKYAPGKLNQKPAAAKPSHSFAGFDDEPALAPADPPQTAAPADFSAKLRLYADKLAGSPGEQYLSGRGFTQETMSRFMLGYNAEKNEITIPYNRECTYYSTRRIDPAAIIKHWIPSKEDAPDATLFNTAALRQDRPVFVVEAPLCAISIMQEGGCAVGLAGTGKTRMLLEELKKIQAPPLLILSLDNDDPGRKAQEELAENLTAAGINFIQFNAAGTFKDPNEALQNDPSTLRGLVSAGYQIAEGYAAELKEKAIAAYDETSTAGTFDDFLGYIRRNANRSPIPTGFPSLDKILNGGLVPGLYIMGAVSSLGKTALMVNIADNIAAAGTDVLYFSLEMSKYELMARSISRLSFNLAGKEKSNTDEAFSTFGVLFGAKYINDSSSLLPGAMEIYRQTIAPHIWYFEGVGSIGVNHIRDAVRNHIAKTGRRPAVFIDYLQLLAAPDPRATDKHNTDLIVITLKQMSRDEDVPVFCISSLNRTNYNEPINMAAYKETGSIEYTSDVLIGLQLYGIGYKAGEKEQARKARIQDLVTKAEKDDRISIQVRVLKNRNGKRGDSGELKFTKRFNSFFEMPDDFKEVYTDENPFNDEDDDDAVVLRR